MNIQLTEAQLIKLGGKVWEKGTMRRIYLNAAACKALINQSEYSKMQEKSLNKARTYFDTVTNELKSDNGTVRVMFNQQQIACSK